MAETHPYISGGGALVKAIQQFRNSLPSKIDSDVLKKLGLAPMNESRLINILQFIGLIGDDGATVEGARTIFSQTDNSAFAGGLAKMVKAAYTDLFGLHGEAAWSLPQGSLVTFFRNADKTSAIVGTRQATTFQTLAALAGHGDVDTPRDYAPKKEKDKSGRKAGENKTTTGKSGTAANQNSGQGDKRGVGLTVRIEVNLPASGDQETYDRIFKSIRENLLNG